MLLLVSGATETTNATMGATRKNVRHFIGERARRTPTPLSLAQKMMGRLDNTGFMVGFLPVNSENSYFLLVNITAKVSNVLEIKELEGFWQSKVAFELEWFDSRLEMQNLKVNDNFNLLADEERNSIWFPEIIFGNNDNVERIVLDSKALLIVHREGESWLSPYEDNKTAEIFAGSSNPFFYSRTYSTKFECDFQLQSYPFDTQECTMELVVPSSQRFFN